MENINLKSIFNSLQRQMIQKLTSNREIISHPTAKGDCTELDWRGWLSEYLPERYKVDKAFIIDSNNNFSEQIDLVIYDRQYSPFILKQEGILYIPAESIYAVFEVKQDINKYNVEYAKKKIESVRRLHRTSTNIVHAGGKFDPKPPFEIIGGILTLTASWKDAFGKSFKDIICHNDNFQWIDLGCILEKGSFVVTNNDRCDIILSSKEDALIYFFLSLLIQLQQRGTVPALDINAYANAIVLHYKL